MTLTNRIKNAPKQQRSRETLAAILQATVEVLRDSADGSFSLREVAERAGISQGTLYARFPTRDELIEYVHLTLWDNNQAAVEAFAAAQAQTIPTGPAERAPDRATLERLVRTAIAWYAGHMREQRPVLMALTRAMNLVPRLATLQREQTILQIARITEIAKIMLGSRWSPETQTRFDTATRIVVGLVRDTSILGPADPACMRLTVEDLVERLTPIALGLIDG